MLQVGELCSVRKGKGVEEGIYILIYMAVATGTAGTAMAIPHFYSINIMSDRQSRFCNISNLLRLLIISQDQTRLRTIIILQATLFNRKLTNDFPNLLAIDGCGLS